jgi:hypothetical protein
MQVLPLFANTDLCGMIWSSKQMQVLFANADVCGKSSTQMQTSFLPTNADLCAWCGAACMCGEMLCHGGGCRVCVSSPGALQAKLG